MPNNLESIRLERERPTRNLYFKFLYYFVIEELKYLQFDVCRIEKIRFPYAFDETPQCNVKSKTISNQMARVVKIILNNITRLLI